MVNKSKILILPTTTNISSTHITLTLKEELMKQGDKRLPGVTEKRIEKIGLSTFSSLDIRYFRIIF